MNKILCPYCDDLTQVELVKEKETICVRGENVVVDSHFLKCSACSNTFDDPKDKFDVLDMAYRTYRNMHNLLQPEEIKSWRQRIGLTQVELSRLLGLGDVTINRYEGGKLQEVSNDKTIRLAMVPNNLLSLIHENETAISDKDKRNKLINALQEDYNREFTFENIYEQKFGNYEPNEYSGFKKLDINKIFETILFFCTVPIFKTKINKLLFYMDFKFFKEHATSITGLEYLKWEHGPVPAHYEYYLATLIQNGSVGVNEINFDDKMTGEEYTANRKPDLSIFSDEEIKTLIEVKEYFKKFNVSKIRNLSHEESGYISTDQNERISYNFAKDLKI